MVRTRPVLHGDTLLSPTTVTCKEVDNMSRRFTYDFVKLQFEKEGYTLLTTEYKNNKQKLETICPRGHRWTTRWNDFQQGHRCVECYNNERGNSQRLSINKIRSEFKREGYQLFTTEYKNAHQKLRYICPNGHRGSISWSSWKNGSRCAECIGNKKKTIEYVRSEFARRGYKLLSREYLGAHSKLEFICPKGHHGRIIWNSFYRGARCLLCYRENNVGENHHNWNGGIACEPYCDVWLDKEFKEDIKKRDGYKCMNPDCWHTTDKLCMHHINYNKKDCRPENLITICISCNSRANFNRESWKKYYNSIQKRRSIYQ